MSYDTDMMRALSYALKGTDGLKNSIGELNANVSVFRKLAIELTRTNDLKEVELGLMTKEEYLQKRSSQETNNIRRK